GGGEAGGRGGRAGARGRGGDPGGFPYARGGPRGAPRRPEPPPAPRQGDRGPREVEEAIVPPADLGLCAPDGGNQVVGGARIGGRVREPGGELVPGLVACLPPTEFVDGRLRERAELVVRDGLP